jgi:hypothetical protein
MKTVSRSRLTPELLRDLWNPVPMRPGTPIHVSLGTLELWVRHLHEDWFVAFRRADPEVPLCPPHPVRESSALEGLPWRRWVSGSSAAWLRLIPALPDRSVVVRPSYPLNVPTGESVLFYANVPIWVRVAVGEKAELTLCEIPSVILSNTWFGEPTAGELCYSLKTKAQRDLEAVSNHPYMAACPVHVENQAPTDLEFQRICVRVEHLHVFRGRQRLWTNQVEVLFKGEDFASQITVLKYAPKVEQVSERLCPAREPVERSLLKKSFSFLRSLTGI